ncbi:tetratricopeptide repeat protein [Candidatus Hydrogenedentota bacterium]
MAATRKTETQASADARDEKAASIAEMNTRSRTNTVEAPWDFKAKTLFINLGKTLGNVVNWYEKLTEVDSETIVDRYRKKGTAEFERGRFAEAAENFTMVVELQSGNAWAYCMLGRSLARIGNDTKAAECLRKATALDPNSAETHFQLGLLLCEKDELKDAKAELGKVAELAPLEPKGHYRLGIVHDKLGEYDKALKALNKALELRPQSPKINQRLGFVYEGKGDHAEALKFFKKAAELEDSIM